MLAVGSRRNRRQDSRLTRTREVEGEVYGQYWWNRFAGVDVMRQVVDGTFLPPGLRLMGIHGLEVSEGLMVAAMPASGWLASAFGVTDGGDRLSRPMPPS